MRKLLLATTALAALAFAAPAQAQNVENLGANPTSATGTFQNSVFGTSFVDFYQFQLTGPFPAFIAFATAENTFVQPTDEIANFIGQLFSQVGVPGGGDDTPVNLPVMAVGCPTNPDGCQVLSGSAFLPGGSYYLQLTGTGGGTSGYTGSVTTLAVPGPLAGGGLLGLFGLAWLFRRRLTQAKA